MNRRLRAVLAITFTMAVLSSCATFNRNNVAAKVGDRKLTAQAAQTLLASTAAQPATGDQLRGELTSWILVQLLGDQAKAKYQAGLAGGALVCLAAIPVASADTAKQVLAALSSGTSFAVAATKYSTNADLASSGGILVGSDGRECFNPATLTPGLVTALTGVPVGRPVAADLGTFSAVVLLRPFDELQLGSQSEVASTILPQAQLATLLAAAKIYIDPRYGRWDTGSHSVVPLSS